MQVAIQEYSTIGINENAVSNALESDPIKNSLWERLRLGERQIAGILQPEDWSQG